MKKKRQRMTSTTIYIHEEQDDELDELSRKTGLSKAYIVRRGIDMVIAEMQDEVDGRQ